MKTNLKLILLAIVLCACTGTEPNRVNTPVPSTPDLAATVSAAVKATSDFNAAVVVALKATEQAAVTLTPPASPTPQPTNTLVQTATSTPLPPPTATSIPPTLTAVPTNTPRPIALAPQPVATATSAVPAGFSAKVTIQKAGYERWGRSQGMIDPNWQGGYCTGDDKHPILKLGISLALTNTGSRDWPAGTRNMYFFKTDGTKAFTCSYSYLTAYPPTKPGQDFQMSYTVYVELSERVAYGIFEVTDVGKQRFEVPTNLPLP